MIPPDRGSPARNGSARALGFALLSLVLCAACDERDSRTNTFSVLDSAGVTIVESTGPLWGREEGWTVSPDPQVVIGLREGDERYLLTDVRGVRRLSDGRIAVLDQGSYRVRVYDSTGAHLMDLGGEGDGPAEFRTPQFLGIISDTLFVYEAIGGAVTWFSPDGQLLRTSNGFDQDERRIGTLLMFGYLEDRTGIGIRTGGATYRPREAGINREPWSIWRFGLVNPGVDSLVSVPGGEVEIVSSDGRGTLQRRYVFGKWTCLTASKDRIFVAATDDFAIQERDREGDVQRIIRRDEAPRRVSRSDVARWVDETIAMSDGGEDEKAEMRRTARQLKVAETMPAFRWIGVDSEDNLWVEEWKGIGIDQGNFSVFRPDGAWLGSVGIPAGLAEMRLANDHQLIEIGPDYFLGVWTDQVGVEQVRLYRIEKS